MSITLTINSADSALPPDASAIAAYLGACQSGTVGSVFSFNPGADVHASLGDGPGTEAVLSHLRNTGVPCKFVRATGGSTALSAVTHGGTGPTVTASGTPTDNADIRLTVTKAGAGGTGQASLAVDGASYDQMIDIPAEPPPSILGTVDLVGLTLSTLAATTLIFTAPAAFTVTFASPTSIQDIADQINAQAISGSKVNRAEIKQTAAGVKNLRLYTTTGGASVSLTIDAASTGDAILGVSGTDAGEAATYLIPYTGVTLTFPTGAYVLGDTYQITASGPACTVAALGDAADALRLSGEAFGFIAIAQPAANPSDARALINMMDTKISTWATDTAAPIFVTYLANGSLHTASSTKATNEVNIATNDNAMKLAFAGHVDKGTVCDDDIYITGSKLLGSHRRPLSLLVAQALAGNKLSDDPGNGSHQDLTECSISHPDTLTYARDENTATVTMGGSAGPGFTTARVRSGKVRIMRGVTRAGQSSRFVDIGPYRATLRAAQVLRAHLEKLENTDYETNPDGTLLDEDLAEIKAGIREELLQAVVREPTDYMSDCTVELDATEVVANTRNITPTVTLRERAQVEFITCTLNLAGVFVLGATT